MYAAMQEGASVQVLVRYASPKAVFVSILTDAEKGLLVLSPSCFVSVPEVQKEVQVR